MNHRPLPFCLMTTLLATAACGSSTKSAESASAPPNVEEISANKEGPAPPRQPDVPSEMVLVPGAELRFERPDDGEVRTSTGVIKINSFLVDKLEATVAEYLACRDSGQCTSAIARMPQCNAAQKKGRIEHPINCISWHEAQRYCASKNKRLPTAAEWELAARGTDQRHYPWGNALPAEQLCWQGRLRKQRETTCPVGRFPEGASPYGVLDMAGNVAEWTSTALEGVYPKPVYDTRGGGYLWEQLDSLSPDETAVRADSEGGLNASASDPQVGVRCARSLDGTQG